MAPAPSNRSKFSAYGGASSKAPHHPNGRELSQGRGAPRAQGHGSSMVALGRNSTQNQLAQRAGKVTVPRPLNLPSLKKDSGVLHVASLVPSTSVSGWNRTEASDPDASGGTPFQKDAELPASGFPTSSNWGAKLSKTTFPPLSAALNADKELSAARDSSNFSDSKSPNGSILHRKDFPSLKDTIPVHPNPKQKSKPVVQTSKDDADKSKVDVQQEQEEKWRLRQQQLKREEQQMQLDARQKHDQIEAQKNAVTERVPSLQPPENFSSNRESPSQTESLPQRSKLEPPTRPGKASDDARINFQPTLLNHSKQNDGDSKPSESFDSWKNTTPVFPSNAPAHDNSRNWADDERQMSPTIPSYASRSDRFDALGGRRNANDERNPRPWSSKEPFHLSKQPTREFGGKENSRFESKMNQEDINSNWPTLTAKFSQTEDSYHSKRPTSPLDSSSDKWHSGGKSVMGRSSGKNIPPNGSSLIALDILPLPKLGIEPPPLKTDPRLRLQRRKKGVAPYSSDFVDLERQKFEAELERVQRQKEEERMRKTEGRETLEKAHSEIPEKEAEVVEEVRPQEPREKEADRDATNSQVMEALERMKEKRQTIWDEEKKRKENARRKLIELEERIASREMEKKSTDKDVDLKQEETLQAPTRVDDAVPNRAQEGDVKKDWDEEEEKDWKAEESMVALITEDVSVKNPIDASTDEATKKSHGRLVPLHVFSNLWNRDEENEKPSNEGKYWKKDSESQDWTFHQAYLNEGENEKGRTQPKETVLPENLDGVDSGNRWNAVSGVPVDALVRNSSWEDALAMDESNAKNRKNGEMFELKSSDSVYVAQSSSSFQNSFHSSGSVNVPLKSEESVGTDASESKENVQSQFPSDKFNWDSPVGLGDWLRDLSQSPPSDKPFSVDHSSTWKSMTVNEFQKKAVGKTSFHDNSVSTNSIKATEKNVYSTSHPHPSSLVQIPSLFDGTHAESSMTGAESLKDTEYHLWQEQGSDVRQGAMVVQPMKLSSAEEIHSASISSLVSDSSQSTPFTKSDGDSYSAHSSTSSGSHSSSIQSTSQTSTAKFSNRDLPVVMPPLGLPPGGAFWQAGLPTIQIGSMNLPLDLGITFGELHNPLDTIFPSRQANESNLIPESSLSPTSSTPNLPNAIAYSASNADSSLNEDLPKVSVNCSESSSISSSFSAYDSSFSSLIRNSNRTRKDGFVTKTWQPKQTSSSHGPKLNDGAEFQPPFSDSTSSAKSRDKAFQKANSVSSSSNSNTRFPRKDYKSNPVFSKNSSLQSNSSPILPLPNPSYDSHWKPYSSTGERSGLMGRGRALFPLRGRGRANLISQGKPNLQEHIGTESTPPSFTFTAQSDVSKSSRNKSIRRYPLRKVERWKEVKMSYKPKIRVEDVAAGKKDDIVSAASELINSETVPVLKEGQGNNYEYSLLHDETVSNANQSDITFTNTLESLNIVDVSSHAENNDILRKDDNEGKDDGDDFIEVISKRRRRERQKLERAKSREARDQEQTFNRKVKNHSVSQENNVSRKTPSVNVSDRQQLVRSTMLHPPNSYFSSSSLSSSPLNELNSLKYKRAPKSSGNLKASNYRGISPDQERKTKSSDENKSSLSPKSSAWKNGFSPIQILSLEQTLEGDGISSINRSAETSSSTPLPHPLPSFNSDQDSELQSTQSSTKAIEMYVTAPDISPSLTPISIPTDTAHVDKCVFSNSDVVDSDMNLELNRDGENSTDLSTLQKMEGNVFSNVLDANVERKEGEATVEVDENLGREVVEDGKEFDNEDHAEAVVALAISNGDDDHNNSTVGGDEKTDNYKNTPLDSSSNLTREGTSKQDEPMPVSLPADLSLDHHSSSLPLTTSTPMTDPSLPPFNINDPPSSSHPIHMHSHPLHSDNEHDYSSFPPFSSNPSSSNSFLPSGGDHKGSRHDNSMHDINSADSPLGPNHPPSWSLQDRYHSSHNPKLPFIHPFIQASMPGGIQGGMHPMHPPPPPLMLFHNSPFSANGYFSAMGMGYVPAYLPTDKMPDWKHTPANNTVHLGGTNHRTNNIHSGNNSNNNMNGNNQSIVHSIHNNGNSSNNVNQVKGVNDGINGTASLPSPPPSSPDGYPRPPYPSGFPLSFQMDSSKPPGEKPWPNIPSLPNLNVPPAMNFSPLQTSSGFPEPSPLSSDSPHFPDELGFGDISLPLSSTASPATSSSTINNPANSGRYQGEKHRRSSRSSNKIQIRMNFNGNVHNNHNNNYSGQFNGGDLNNPSHPHHHMYQNEGVRIPPEPFFHNPLHNGRPNPHREYGAGAYRPDVPSYPHPVHMGKDLNSAQHRRGFYVEVRNPPLPPVLPHPHPGFPPNQMPQDRFFRNRQGSFLGMNNGGGNRADGIGKNQGYKVKQDYTSGKGSASSTPSSSASSHAKNSFADSDTNLNLNTNSDGQINLPSIDKQEKSSSN